MIGDLLQALDRVEPKNPVLYHEFAKVFCRVVSVFVIYIVHVGYFIVYFAILCNVCDS